MIILYNVVPSICHSFQTTHNNCCTGLYAMTNYDRLYPPKNNAEFISIEVKLSRYIIHKYKANRYPYTAMEYASFINAICISPVAM